MSFVWEKIGIKNYFIIYNIKNKGQKIVSKRINEKNRNKWEKITVYILIKTGIDMFICQSYFNVLIVSCIILSVTENDLILISNYNHDCPSIEIIIDIIFMTLDTSIKKLEKNINNEKNIEKNSTKHKYFSSTIIYF